MITKNYRNIYIYIPSSSSLILKSNFLFSKKTKLITLLTILLLLVTQSFQDCTDNCVKCSTSDPSKCETCSDNYYLESSSSPKCRYKRRRCQYYDQENKKCQYCEPGTVLHTLEGYCESAASRSTGPYLLLFFVVICLISLLSILYIILTGGYINRIQMVFKKSPTIKEEKMSKFSAVSSNFIQESPKRDVNGNFVVAGEGKGNNTKIINNLGNNSGNLTSMAKIQKYSRDSTSRFQPSNNPEIKLGSLDDGSVRRVSDRRKLFKAIRMNLKEDEQYASK